MDYFKFLHAEITLDILSRVVPTESVLDCKLVCKTWRSLVRHPSFSKMHSHHLNHHDSSGKLGFIVKTKIENNKNSITKFQYFEYNENHDQSTTPIQRIRRFNFTLPLTNSCIVGSINGLICLADYRCGYRSVICNPITKECVVLPELKRGCSDAMRYVYGSISFGYVSSTNEYKVVDTYGSSTESVEVHIYTLGSGSGWRSLGKFDSKFSTFPWQRPSFLNGALYWMDFHSKMIVTFDLAEEKFCECLSSPPLPPEGLGICSAIGILDGFLFYSFDLINVAGSPKCCEIWLLKKKNGNHDKKVQEDHQSLGWTKVFRIDKRNKLLAITKSDGVLTKSGNYLYTYDPKASTSKRLVDFEGTCHQVFPHKNTLVSLKELGEEDTHIMESIEVEETEIP